MHGDVLETATVRVVDSLEPLAYTVGVSRPSHNHGDSTACTGTRSELRKKAAGRYAADLFLQLPARESGSAAVLGNPCHRLYRYLRTTTDAIGRRYGAISPREARIHQSE